MALDKPSIMDSTTRSEDGYVSSEDEDFDPTKAAAEAKDDLSDSEAENVTFPVNTPKSGKSKQGAKDGHAEDLGFENSGDEATIRKGRKRKRKDEKGKEDDSGGEGGFVRTRRMRAVEEKETKLLASADGATVDVDSLWKSLNSKESVSTDRSTSKDTVLGTTGPPPTKPSEPIVQDISMKTPTTKSPDSSRPEDMITINRSYVFAGETITEEKSVPKSSAEANLYLQAQQSPSSVNPAHPPLRRPLKRKSRFEPNPEGIVKGLPASANKGPKLNVVEKSKLDWAGYVDKEGMQDELRLAEKAKDGYLSRTDFLGRVEAKREDELKSARSKK